MIRSRTFRRLNSQAGEMNIVLLAAALPTLILVATAAVDIIRFPAVKQQIRAAIHASVQQLTVTLNSEVEIGTGMNWCVLPYVDETPMGCGTAGACAVPEDCTNCGCSGGVSPTTGKYALSNAADSILTSLTGGSGAFYAHDKKDLAINVGMYNLLVNSGTGEPVGRETVYIITNSNVGGGLEFSVDLDEIVDGLLGDASKKILGVQIGSPTSPRYYHVPVLVAVVAVRVKHIFNFTDELRFGHKSQSNKDSSVMLTTVIKPLPRIISLHGTPDST